MSIIHDALKKVQEKNAKEPRPELPAQMPASTVQATAAAATEPLRHSPLTIIAGSTISIVVIIIFSIIWNLAQGTREHITITASQVPIPKINHSVPSPVPAPGAVTNPAAEPVVAPAPVAPPTQPKADPNDPFATLKIEGIMDMGGGKKVALISGNMYEEGQTIYGRIIAQITIDSVTIVDDGKKRTFLVNPPKP